jgi:hypothetical protein
MISPTEQAAARTIGTVESVGPSEIMVLLELDAPQAVSLHSLQPLQFPRINGYVLIPAEAGSLVGVISWLGIERSPYPKRPGLKDFGLVDLPFPLRKMRITPLGTLVRTTGDGEPALELRRGILAFPSVGDSVLVPTTSELRALVEARGQDRRVTIGTSVMAGDIPVSVDPDKMFGRHLAVLGNTGSGKSCSVAGLIRWSLEAAREKCEPPNARFIVLDPNGEYRKAFTGLGEVRVFEVASGSPPDANPLVVPAWLWNSHEWTSFAQAAPGTQRPLLMQTLRNLRAGESLTVGPALRLARLLRGYKTRLEEKLAQGPTGYSGGFGVKKDCGKLLENLGTDASNYLASVSDVKDELEDIIRRAEEIVSERRWWWEKQNTWGYDDFNETVLSEIVDLVDVALVALPSVQTIGGASEDAPLSFDPRDVADHLDVLATTEDFSQAQSFVATLSLRVRSMLADTRLVPIVAPGGSITLPQWLDDFVGAPGAANGAISVLDLSMVPADVIHLVVAVIARVVFEALQRHRKIYGSELPTAVVLEEAHTFVQRRLPEEGWHAAPSRTCRETFERIAREGRKFGLGLVLSSQRPSDVSETVLSQCNTFLLHRLVNDRDQNLVGRLVPDNLGGLMAELPSLPSQQAILLGWAAPVPTMVRLADLAPECRPQSADPAFWDVWTGVAQRDYDWGAVANDWTGSSADQAEPAPKEPQDN